MLDTTVTRDERRELDADLFARVCKSHGIKSTSNNRAQRMAINFMLEAFKSDEINGVMRAIEEYQNCNTMFPDRQELSEAALFIASEANELSERFE